MTPQEQDVLRSVLGDEKAQVLVSRSISDKHYGRGGEVFVSVRLTCDQSAYAVYRAGELASGMAEQMGSKFFEDMKKHLSGLGL